MGTSYTNKNLDVPICMIETYKSDTETPRDFIRSSEGLLNLDEADIDSMDPPTLSSYITLLKNKLRGK